MIFTCEADVVARQKILVPITPSAMPIKYWPIYALLKMSFHANITFYNCNRIQKILYDVYDIGSLFWHDCKIVDWDVKHQHKQTNNQTLISVVYNHLH